MVALAATSALAAGVLPAGAASRPSRTQRPQSSWQQLLMRGSGLIRWGPRLYVNGATHGFTGVNAYELATYWPVNAGCGSQVNNLTSFFSALPRGSVVRFWAFEALAVNKYTHRIDFAALDRVVNAAASRGILLILTLSDQAGTCEGQRWHDASWYTGGYRELTSPLEPLPYLDWVKMIVSRYRNSPAVGMWEPVNEPEASNCLAGYSGWGCAGHTVCPAGATAALRGFFDRVGGLIHRLDPGSLVSAGLSGGNQCGITGADYLQVARSPGLDVLTFHDYGEAKAAIPAELTLRVAQAAQVGKPLFVEEAGIRASAAGVGCATLAGRAVLAARKMTAALASGLAGWLIWDWVPVAQSGCSYDVGPGDPVLAVLRAGMSPVPPRLPLP